MKLKNVLDVSWSSIVFVLVLISAITMLFLKTAGIVTNDDFYIVYGLLGLAALIGTGFSILYQGVKKSDGARVFFISASDKFRILSSPIQRLSVVVVVSIVVIIGVFAAGEFVNVPNPYSAGEVTKSVLDQKPALLNAFLIGFYPGIDEELPVFFFINGLNLAFLFTLSRVNPGIEKNFVVFLMTTMVSVVAGSLLFTVAHLLAYGNNTAAFLSAFVFEFVVQTMNQVTGAFLSFIPHIIHNVMVVFQTQVAFAIGGFASLLLVPGQAISRAFTATMREFKWLFFKDLQALRGAQW